MSTARPDGLDPAASPLPGGRPGAPPALESPGDLSALRQTQLALLRSQADLRRWAAAQDQAQQNERRRIARELHDELQQTLASIQLELAALGERLAAVPADAAAAAALLPNVVQLAQTAMESTRRIVNDLRPPILEDLGLAVALEALVDRFAQRSGARHHFQASGAWDDAEPLSLDLAHGLYRVAQEALKNAARHAQARQVHVDLHLGPCGSIVMRIRDDGRGIDLQAWRKPGSFGLLGMYERVHALGGELHVHSNAGSGTTVEVVLGVDRRAEPCTGLQAQRPGEEAFDSLLSFLYRAPIGLVQAGLDGHIEMLNPMAANLLMPLTGNGQLDNLFVVLQGVVPQLRTQAHALQGRSGVVCEGLHLLLPSGPHGLHGRGPAALTLSVLKQDNVRLMAVLSPVSAEAAEPGPPPAAAAPR